MSDYRRQRQFFRVLIGLVVLAVATGFPGPGPGAAGAAASPQVGVTETTHDFGKVVEDQALMHTFIIKNNGGQPLKIEDVDPDCACTAASYDQTVPPGAEGKLTLKIKPYSVMHQFKKKTRVRFNDPDKPLVVFILTGTAQPFIEIKPSHIVRLRGNPGDNLQAEVRFTSHIAEPFKITKIRTSMPDKIDMSLQEVEPGKVFVLTVKNKRQEAGAYGGLVELFTNSQKRPRLIVRVFGELYLPSTGNP